MELRQTFNPSGQSLQANHDLQSQLLCNTGLRVGAPLIVELFISLITRVPIQLACQNIRMNVEMKSPSQIELQEVYPKIRNLINNDKFPFAQL